MGFYFAANQSLHAATGTDVRSALRAIVQRYVTANPPHPFTYRPYRRAGIQRGKDYRYHVDFRTEFPQARQGQFVYLWAKLWVDARAEYRFDVNCQSPLQVYLNRQPIFRSDIFCERNSERRVPVTLALQPGWNHCVVRVQKTRAGFGGSFGTWLGKHPYYFVLPTAEREAQEGWLYSEPVTGAIDRVPGEGDREADTGLVWHPRADWPESVRTTGNLQRLFGAGEGRGAVAWTRLCVPPVPAEATMAARPVRLRGTYAGDLTVWLNETEVGRAQGAGDLEWSLTVPPGTHDLWVRSLAPVSASWHLHLTVAAAEGDGAPGPSLQAPAALAGAPTPWFYLGPLSAEAAAAAPDFANWRDLDRLWSSSGQGLVYWRLDAPDTWVRPYNDNPLYAKWNYPLGVTLYGLLHSGRVLAQPEIEAYVVGHIQRCCDTYDYAMWDKDQFGGATNVHHLLTSLDSLDDCGSFGSALLETARFHSLRNHRRLADLVADYIAHRQARLPDGTFYRLHLMHTFHENTLWADDLYMSVPFLCRYYLLTGEMKYLDDAARQFLGFRQRLYLPELRLMSHVFDFRKNLATGIPWGRGNGWTVFSLAELLTVLPETHALRAELLQFYRELCAGYLACQGPTGMWHQVLNEHDAYPETSCTSMFTYAFARGLRRGWLENPTPYAAALERAWEALTRGSIDAAGNVHGVCRGSEFSFTSDYYKRDLLWNLNDTHGVGIVLLAGVEVLRWREGA